MCLSILISFLFFLEDKRTNFTEAQNKLLARHADVKTHEILVLLLRLRQVCCHPALIHEMLDQEDVQQSEIEGMGTIDPELLSRVHRMSLNTINNMEEEDTGIDRRIVGNLLTRENPVFDNDRTSSKVMAIVLFQEFYNLICVRLMCVIYNI